MKDLLRRAVRPGSPEDALPPAGLHHFVRTVDGRMIRYHLRVEPDGSALLVANATAVLQLSSSGATLAHALLRWDQDEAVRRTRRAFRGASEDRVVADVQRMRAALDEMADARGAHPLRSVDDPESTVHRRTLSAPLSADVVAGDAARVQDVLRRLWDIGIPQVVLVVPEGRVSPHLARLVERAEDLGLVTGVRARATDLLGPRLLDDVAMAGLDHLDLCWAGPPADAHDALFGSGDFGRALDIAERCHALELAVVAVTPLVTSTLEHLDEMAAALQQRRVSAWAVFAVADRGEGGGQVLGAREVRQAATTVEELADHHGLNLLWSPPVEREPSMALTDQVARGPRTTSEAGVRIDPAGTVVAPVGRPTATGDLLRDPWPSIWAHPSFRHWRESVDDPPRCEACPELAVCSAGCPSDPMTWARAPEGDAP